MRIRTLLGFLAALVVLFAPSVASAAEGGIIQSNHHAEMIAMGQCQSPPCAHGDQDKNAGHSCCIAMCLGLPCGQAAQAITPSQPHAPANFAISTLHLAELVETATPPPRLFSRISSRVEKL